MREKCGSRPLTTRLPPLLHLLLQAAMEALGDLLPGELDMALKEVVELPLHTQDALVTARREAHRLQQEEEEEAQYKAEQAKQKAIADAIERGEEPEAEDLELGGEAAGGLEYLSDE
jgi:hypothetical protein